MTQNPSPSKPTAENFIPAAGYHFLTGCYDIFIRLFFHKIFKKIVRTIHFAPDTNLLDVACGPGNILLKINKRHPDIKLVGLDIDPAILKIAAKKIKTNPNIQLVQASATHLPFANEHFDIVISSLAFHHLTTEQKQLAFNEIYRVLKKGGIFWLYDFAKPIGFWGKFLAKIYRHLEEVDDGIQNKLPLMYQKAGFNNIRTHWTTHGMISLLSGQK